MRLAARCQHIGRWEIPRNRYQDGRTGYLKWRSDLMRHHAHTASDILRGLDYDEATIQRVCTILLKQGIKRDEEVQVMENALCLVFLSCQYEDFHTKNADRIVDILYKSLLKMDAQGHHHALNLPYSAAARASIEAAVARLFS